MGAFQPLKLSSIQQMFAVLYLGLWEGIKETRRDPCVLVFFELVQELKVWVGKY